MKQRAVVIAVGVTGGGKTYFLRSLLGRAPRLLIVDVTGDYAELPGLVTHTHPADVVAEWRGAGAGPCRVRLMANLEGASLRALLDGGGDDEVRQLYLDAAAIAFAARDVVLVLDELSLCCTPNDTPRPLRLVMTMGRHRGVSLLAGTQRPALVSRTVTGMASYTAFFRLEDPPDLDWAAKKLGSDRASELLRLQVGQHVGAGDARALDWLRAGCPPGPP